MRNKKKCFLFRIKNSFCSWDNQILTFKILKCHDIIKCQSKKHGTLFTEWIPWEVNTVQSWNYWLCYHWIMNQFFDPLNQKCVKLPSFTNHFSKFTYLLNTMLRHCHWMDFVKKHKYNVYMFNVLIRSTEQLDQNLHPITFFNISFLNTRSKGKVT